MMEQPWSFWSPVSDAWYSDFFTNKETDTLTQALQSPYGGIFSSEMLESLFAKPDTAPTISGVSENESLVSKQRLSVPSRGKVAKRKSRASKRTATTTFIIADPENFMQMVQQATGVRLGGLNERLPVAPMLKLEPHRLADGLPTLDTSSFFLDGAASSMVSDGGAAASEQYFDSFCSFPTLESWKAA